MKTITLILLLLWGWIFPQDLISLTPKQQSLSSQIDCRDSFYCQNPDYSAVYNMSSGFGSEIADDIPNELVGYTIDEITLWVGEYYGDWQDPDGVTVNFYYEECPPELEPALSYFIPWTQWEITEVYDGYALVYESTATLPEPVEVVNGMSIGAFVNISWGSAEPFAGICATAMWESYGCNPAYLDGTNWGYTRWTSIDNYTDIPQDLAFCLTGSFEDNIINVPEDYATIQEALNNAINGDTVLVSIGTYTENITWPATNGIKLIGANRDRTFIDGDGLAGVILFEEALNGIIDSSTLISNFTIQNGANTSGSGICCYSANPNLQNLTITNNSAYNGGGIACYQSSPNLQNVIIDGNSASSGGGLFCYVQASPTLTNVTISNNIATYGSGGIACVWDSSPTLNNVTISGNSAEWGGGICCLNNANLNLTNCILWDNSPENIYSYENNNPNSVTIEYSDIQDGEDGIVTSGNCTVYWEDGNITSDPLFTEPSTGDYTLHEDSPCIDAGIDIGNPFFGTAPDMGAFEYEETVSNNYELEITNYELLNAYPNPFNPSTTIGYSLPAPSSVILSIYNINGQLVEQLVDSRIELAGYHSVVWNADNFASGIYIVKLSAGGLTKTQKLVLLK